MTGPFPPRTRPGSRDRMGEDFDATGHLSRSVFDEVGIPPEADVYLCGPTRFMAEMKEALAASGVARKRIHVEIFNGGELRTRLAIDIVDGSPSGLVVDGIPAVKQSSINTNAVVKQGESLMIGGMTGRRLVPGRLQSVAEISYEFVASMIRSTAGAEGMKFFPLIFSLFMFICVSNLIGIIPYTFTVSSHIIVTAALALLVWFTVLIYGVYKNGLKFFKIFVPSGVPIFVLPLVVFIELLSFFFVKPVSHALRLFANMLAGHITLFVFASIAAGMTAFYMFRLWFMTFAGVLVLVHHLWLFFIEVYRFQHFFATLFRAVLSTAATLVLCLLAQAPTLPVFMGTMSFCVRGAIDSDAW